MRLINPAHLLDHVGRHGRLYMSLGALLGLLAPPLASLAAPVLLPALLVTTIVALVRVDWRLLRDYAARPLLLLPKLNTVPSAAKARQWSQPEETEMMGLLVLSPRYLLPL